MADILDVAIVGGGPAGQAAALHLAGRGLDIAVIDEQPRPGGQILRQPPASFTVPGWLAGRGYARLKHQLARFEALDDIRWLGGCSVLDLAPTMDGLSLLAATPGGISRIRARHVLVATGCQDLAVPLPGWTLPGVMSAGGIQAFVKSQRFIPGERILLAGTHPLQLIVAEQVVRAGGEVAAILFAQPRAGMIATAMRHPLIALRRAPDLAAAASAMATLRRAGVPVRFGAPLHAISGMDRVTGAVTGMGEIACDTVGLCYGFVPQSALPRMAGARMHKAGPAGGWACAHDHWLRSSVVGLSVAGEALGVAGAAAAAAGGAIAGIGIARDLGLFAPEQAERMARPHRHAFDTHRAFAAMLDSIADPTGHLPRPDAETLLCRCEDVSFETICGAIEQGGSANAIKLATRCGMGACQGRNCEPALLRLLGDVGRGDDPGFTARFPARPVAIGDLAESG
ncbi:NAD(P)/FAD-dependent oxidoreductase [Sphingomonas colocasiae]|uniref:FAD-dependent oxidoreductase n=1 Tax=Sphingomonas colocasiae TaxID=1848973 RepID=A0ABS7PL35_9SPHN|nr:NAD(P)/FAD-dependent oxidoreductase [Sphingomonas colocasiae]MBY8821445.1 FAD-dependent oxidoreductase [Sphingomonas colocasiae]